MTGRWARGALALLVVLVAAVSTLGARAWKLGRALNADRLAAQRDRARADSLARHSAATRGRATIERLRAEAGSTPGLVVTLVLDSARLTLRRDGLPLREMAVQLPTAGAALPRGTFAVTQVEGKKDSTTVRLGDGPSLYASPAAAPVPDTAAVRPGAVRLLAKDFKAITPNLTVGVPVFIYE
jgi:hypothetical protein